MQCYSEHLGNYVSIIATPASGLTAVSLTWFLGHKGKKMSLSLKYSNGIQTNTVENLPKADFFQMSTYETCTGFMKYISYVYFMKTKFITIM